MTAPLHNDNVEGEASKPFVVLHGHIGMDPAGQFRPGAGIRITPALRTSGLLLAMPAEDLKSLITALTYVTANGWIHPSVEQLAEAMRVPPVKVRQRMRRLAAFSWDGEPVLRETRHEGGLHTFSPSRHIIGSEDAPAPAPEAAPTLPPLAHREEVIANSRERYARRRKEVEYEMALRQGWKLPGEQPAEPESTREAEHDPVTAAMHTRLIGIGMPQQQADLLISRYPLDRIARQLDFLPYRNARDRVRFLIAAVEHDYDPPLHLRHGAEKTDSPTALDASEADTNTKNT